MILNGGLSDWDVDELNGLDHCLMLNDGPIILWDAMYSLDTGVWSWGINWCRRLIGILFDDSSSSTNVH